MKDDEKGSKEKNLEKTVRTILIGTAVGACFLANSVVKSIPSIIFNLGYHTTVGVNKMANGAGEVAESGAITYMLMFDRYSPSLKRDISNLALATSRGTRYLTIQSTSVARDIYCAATKKEVIPNRSGKDYRRFVNSYEQNGGNVRPAVIYLGRGIKFAGQKTAESVADVVNMFSEVEKK